MKRVVLVFPDTRSMADFIVSHGIISIETNSRNFTLSGVLSEEHLHLAMQQHKAVIKRQWLYLDSSEPMPSPALQSHSIV